LGRLEIRPFGPHDDVDAELDLARRAFGPISASARPRSVASLQASVDAGQIIGAFDGGRLIGSARYHSMRQWWHGRSMPMAGVAGVKVAPEERGRGVGTALMSRILTEISERGYPVSALYPTTAPLYRSVGWEFAGREYETVLPARSLTALVSAAEDGGEPKLRRAVPADNAAIVEVLGRVHEALRDCGPNTRDPGSLTRWLDDEDHFAYLADDGFLSYRWANGHDDIRVDLLAAASARTARAFWQILASHATMAKRVLAYLAPDDPVSWLTRDPVAATRVRHTWMLRLVDAPAAIAARGYPAAASLSVHLEITDQAIPANAGRWMLEVSGGAGRLVRTGEAGARPGSAAGHDWGSALRLGIGGFAALFAGVPLGTLRLAGLAAGGSPAGGSPAGGSSAGGSSAGGSSADGSSADDEALDCAFAGPAFMIDYF